LEQRLRKQDERILDMMGRLEVVQSRVIAASPAQTPVTLPPSPATAPPPAKVEERSVGVNEQRPVVQQPASQESQASQVPAELPKAELQLDETQLSAMKLLGESPKSTRQLTDALKKSREHTARIMKGLYELGLVNRNDSSKPFIYQLTEEGRRRVAS
jgi:DNA-binding transcriptional ArsR family regulator